MPTPAATPAADAMAPDGERLEHHRPDDLLAARADRSQQRGLPLPLGDDDRERVEDDEAADEQRDAGEDQQERVDEREIRSPT